MRNLFFCLMALCLVVTSLPLQAGDYDPSDPYRKYRDPSEKGIFDYDDSGDVPWKEEIAELPAPPAEDKPLTEVKVDNPPIGFKVYLDEDSLSVGEQDRVIRYWLVLESDSGSRNAMYEGLRCDTKEYKTYAYASRWKKGGVNPLKGAQWAPVPNQGQQVFRDELMKWIFCGGITAKSVDEILYTLHSPEQKDQRNPYAEFIDL